MKKAFALIVMLFLLGNPRVNAQVTETNSFNAVNKTIPDGNASGLSQVRAVTSAIVNLSSVRVRLRVAGEFNGDLYAYLRHVREGTTNFCVLLNRCGRASTNSTGYADAGLDVVFDNAAAPGDVHFYRSATNLPAGTALTGAWRPDGRKVDPDDVDESALRTATLDSFNGGAAEGEWTLFVADMASGGTNMLLNWELQFAGIATPVVTWPSPADIVYGTALGASQLNASSPVPGTFAYSPTAGTVLNAGDGRLLSVTFTPADTSKYVPVTKSVSINVAKKALTITAVSTNKVYGAALPRLRASYSGFVNSDTTNNLAAQAVLSTSATAASPVGGYTITAAGASSANYTISYVSGTLTITKASTLGIVSSSRNPSLPNQVVDFTFTLSPIAPGAGTPGGSVRVLIDGVATGAPLILSGGAATFSTANLSHGTHSVAAEYAGDVNFVGATNVMSPNQMINSPPVAGVDVVLRDPTSGVKVPITALLTNDFDADGDTILFVEVSANTANGGTVTTNGLWVFYTPAPGFTNVDTFTYTISDGLVSVPIIGTVNVNIRVDDGPSQNLTIIDLGNGRFSIRGDGIPSREYRLQFADDVQGIDWQPLGEATADLNGIFQFIDLSGSPQRFYRSVYP